jgi:hypothetical protein
MRQFLPSKIWLICLFLAILLKPFGLDAQFAERAKWYAGLTYKQVGLTPVGSNNALEYYFYGVTAGMNYVLLHSNDVVSLGLNPNAIFSIQFNRNAQASILASTPVFLLARLGANATPFNEQKFGIGAGVGLNYSYLSQSSQVVDVNQNVYTMKINQGFINPSAVVELGINARNWNYIFRLHWSLYKPTHDVRIGLDKYDLRFGTGGLGFLYSF